jgi:hypothetical protein
VVTVLAEFGDPDDAGLESHAVNRIAGARIVELPRSRLVDDRDDDLLRARADGRRSTQRSQAEYGDHHAEHPAPESIGHMNLVAIWWW